MSDLMKQLDEYFDTKGLTAYQCDNGWELREIMRFGNSHYMGAFSLYGIEME
jgi:hypothetical protein